MRRRRLIILAVVMAAGVLFVATSPWWLGGVARPIARRFGVTFETYTRLGYGRFAVEGVEVRRPGVVVKVARVEAEAPLVFGWHHLRHAGSPVVATQWSVDVTPVRSTTVRPSGWVPLRAQLLRIAAALNRWVPDFTAGAGVVNWQGGGLRLNAARWHEGELTVTDLGYRSLVVNAAATLRPSEDRIVVGLSRPAVGFETKVESKAAAVSGTAAWWGQTLTIGGRFADQGWLPAEADLEGRSLVLPAERLKLGASYASVDGHAALHWQNDRFVADVALAGKPLPGQAAPPLAVELRGHGDLHSFTVESVHAALPGGHADLSAPIVFDRARSAPGEALFTVNFDLARQPWFKGEGVVSGEAHVVSRAAAAPGVSFRLGAERLRVHDVAAERVSLAGEFDWPELRLSELRVVSAEGDELQGRGGWNFHIKELAATHLSGAVRAASFAGWLPAAIGFERAVVDLDAHGPIGELVHVGHVQVAAPRFGQVKLSSADVRWEGRGSQVVLDSAELVADLSRLRLAGALDPSGVNLTQLEWTDGNTPRLKLSRPASIHWRPLRIDALHLAGPDAAIDANLALGPTGRVELSVRGVRSEWLTPFLTRRGPAWRIVSCAVTGTWDEKQTNLSAAGELNLSLGDGREAIIHLAGRGTHEATWIDALHVTETGAAVADASGRLPFALTPGRAPFVTVEPDGQLVFKATTVPNAAFWQRLAEASGVELTTPKLTADVGGSWMRPTGTLALEAGRVSMDPKRFARPLPAIDAVDVALAADPDGVRIERFALSLEGQRIRATGKLPFSREAWSELKADPAGYLARNASAKITVPNAEISRLAPFLPAALASVGTVQADLSYDRGKLGGRLRLQNAASRPLGPLGVLQDINAEVELSGRVVTLKNIAAKAGGQPVVLSGTVELPDVVLGAPGGAEPRYDITLRGENLPFVRQAGLLMRGDLDLTLRTPEKGPPTIRGKVTLRDSLFLTDVRAFIPRGGGASPTRRPPYFAVETAPLNTWALDVEVVGSRFLRVRMPVFVGVVSTRFHLGGTLGEPRAIGDATFDEGQILMPFASFRVSQGAVRLTEENPSEPTLYLRGTGRHYGYDLTMEVSGPASSPSLVFTSSPALDSEQVLLMVMTGAAPSNEVNATLTHRAVTIGAFFGQSLYGTLTGGSAEPDRLTVDSGEKISRQGKETYSIEYKLNGRWSLTGEYDEFDEYNAGVKWRVTPKKP